MQEIFDALQWLANFFGEQGSSTWLQSAWAWMLEKWLVFYLQMQLEAARFAWGVAKAMLTDLQVLDHVNVAFSALPTDLQDSLRFFHVHDFINTTVTAGMTRFVMRFIPGI